VGAQQQEPTQLGQNISAIASAPTGDKHATVGPIAQDKAAPAVERASASPCAAFALGVAESCGDHLGAHDTALWSEISSDSNKE
jgi:hypothetical protein